MTMAEIMGGNDNDSTNKQVKNLSFSKRRRQQLQNINNSLRSKKALLVILELNRCGGAKDIFTSARTGIHSAKVKTFLGRMHACYFKSFKRGEVGKACH